MADGAAATVLESDSDIEEIGMRDAFEVELAKQLAPETEAGLPGGDQDCLPREAEPYPPLPDPAEANMSADRAKAAAQARQHAEKEAGAALAADDAQGAVDAYTLAMRTSGATAMMLANRAALLMKLKRPCAAIRDCTAAIKISGSMVKAYRVRGIAHQKLCHWRKAHSDVSEAQALKFDEATAEMQKFLAAQCLKLDKASGKDKPGVSAGDARREAREAAREAAREKEARRAPSISVFSTDSVIRDMPAYFPEFLTVERPAVNAANDLSKGQAVVVADLQKAPHLNGKRGVVERSDPRPAAKGRWEVEVRLDGGRFEIKSLKRDNIQTLNKADRYACKMWAQAEKKHVQERKQREDQEERNKFQRCVDAKLSKYQVGDGVRSRLRALRPQDALIILDKVDDNVVNVNEFIKTQVGLLTGQSDSDDEPASKRPRG